MKEIEKIFLARYNLKLLKKHESIIDVLQEKYSDNEIIQAVDKMKKQDGKIELNKLINNFDYYYNLFKVQLPDNIRKLDNETQELLIKYYNEITLEITGIDNIPPYYDFIIMNLLHKLYIKNIPLLYLSLYLKDCNLKNLEQLKQDLNNYEKMLKGCNETEERIKNSRFYKIIKEGNFEEIKFDKQIDLKKQIIERAIAKGFKRLLDTLYWHEEKNIKIIFQDKEVIILQDEQEFLKEPLSKELIVKLEDMLKGI